MSTETFPAERIVIIGCGGIGGWMYEPLLRYLHVNNITTPIYLVDGDIVEERNLLRQNFMGADVGLNKAKALACRYGHLSEGLFEPCERPFFNSQVSIVESFVSPESLTDIVVENSIVMLCVDNNWTRRVIEEHVKDFSNVVVISASNEESDGDVLQYCCYKGKKLTPLLSVQNPDIVTALERPDDIGVTGCAAAQVQNHIANYTSAMVALNFLENYLTLKKRYWAKIKGVRYDLKRFSIMYESTK